MKHMLTYHPEHEYLNALRYISEHGTATTDRTGTGTISVFGHMNMEFDLRNDKGDAIVPALTTKRIHLPSVLHELIWMLSGDTNVRYLKENKVRIWDEWVNPATAEYRTLSETERYNKMSIADRENYVEVTNHMREDGRTENFIAHMQHELINKAGVPTRELVAGDLGPVYGSQWRAWEDTRHVPYAEYQAYVDRGFNYLASIDYEGHKAIVTRKIDQLARLESRIQSNPDCRRLIISAWNVARLDEMQLPPCHTLAQWKIEEIDGSRYLHCKLYQRSGDFFLGVPFNIVFYSVMTHMLAHVFNLIPGKFFHTFGDAHIYTNHFDQVATQLDREPNAPFPTIKFSPESFDYKSIADFKYSDIMIEDYQHQSQISAPVAV